MGKTRILLADDHTIVRKGLCSLLDNETSIDIVGEAEDGREAVEKAQQLLPHVVVIDISMPGLNGLEATRQIKKRNPEIKVLILSRHSNEEYIFQALQVGASGYLVKRAAPRDLVIAIESVQKGEIFLSPTISRIVVDEYLRNYKRTKTEPDRFDRLTDREREILQLLAEGLTSKEIAKKLYLSIKTVQTHRAHIFEKLKIHNLTDLIKVAFQKGMITIDF